MFFYLELLFSLSLLATVVLSQCTYTDNGLQINLNDISGNTFYYYDVTTKFNYTWTPCQNKFFCGTSSVMAAQKNTQNGNCNALGSWDSTVGGSYDASAEQWTITYNNGAICTSTNLPRELQLMLTCTQTATVITGVTNPSGTCTYDYTISGSIFCPNPVSSGGGGSSGLSGGWVFIIILLVVTFVYCTAGFVYNKTQKNPSSTWTDLKTNIPQYGFWSSLPKWTWAGCCVTKEWIASKIGNKGDSHTPIASGTDGN